MAGQDEVIVAAATADSPRPRLRPATSGPVVPAAAKAPVAMIDPLPRPRARPAALVRAVPAAPEPATAQATEAPATEAAPVVLAGLARSLRPEARPKGLTKRRASEEPAIIQAAAVKVQPGGVGILPKKGSICGDRSIRGETMGRITAKVAGCGIEEPVKVTHVAGVKLSQAALMDCPTALALRSWVENGLQPSFGRNPVVELKVAGHYVCRTRNHKKGAKVSEHGKGRAIDISGFTLANGKTISILKGWRGDYGKAIRAAHKAACGPFGTTLGPGSDGYHEDHLHFDTARYRSGPYCR
ncbi:extensin family protein [Aliigemmobacter aestuarii]|uniref:Extensin family protein n=1 Tax=Aliigemmobacter aestuarii TaxID=1445661 RepID=A0A4V6RS42_9RHOB|nr:extensin family protein [Gemmobacter aestuarii]